jgi:Flp pilus assembly protein TadG
MIMNIRRPNMNCNLKLVQQRGVAAVEFALLIILLLMIVAGVIEFGRTFWYYDALTKATRDAARFLSNARVSKDIALDSALINDAETMVMNAATSARVPSTNGNGNYDVAITCDTACDVTPTYITVSVAYQVTIGGWIPIFVPTGTTTWSATLSPYTTMRYMK